MTLKINDNLISIAELTGSSSKYFDTQLEQLIPNSSYSLLGSPLQRQLLKEKAGSSLNYQIKYTPTITDILFTNNQAATITPTQHTIVSGFTLNDYICIDPVFKPGNSPWSITIRLKTPTDFSQLNQFYGAPNSYYYTPGGEIGSNRLFGAGYSSNGSSWNIGWIWGKTVVEPDTWYYYKTSFTGTEYKLEIRKDEAGEEYSLEGSITSSVAIYQSSNTSNGYICLGRQPNNYFRGSIDLSATKITIGDIVWFDGSTVRSDYGTKGHLSKYIEESGINYSDFTTSGSNNTYSYLYIPKPFITQNNSWSIDVEFTTTNASSFYPIISENMNYSFTFGVKPQNNKLGYYLSSNGTSWEANEEVGTNTIEAATTYRVKYEYDAENTLFTSKLLLNNEWVLDYSKNISINPPIRFLQLGTNRSFFGGGSGFKINISRLKITLGDNVWFDGENAVAQEYSFKTPNLIITQEPVYPNISSGFSFDFKVNSNTFTEGTKYLLELPNLIKIKTENNDLQFKFPFLNNNWKKLRTRAGNSVVQDGVNSVSITANPEQVHYYAYTSNSNTIYLRTNNSVNSSYLKNVGSAWGRMIVLDDGIVTSFVHDINYLTCIDYINAEPNLTSYELITRVRPFTSNPGENLGIIDSSGSNGSVGIRLCIGANSQNKITYRVSTDGNLSYPVSLTSTTVLPVNELTYIKATYNSTTGYALFTSTDGLDWNLEQENTSVTTRPYVATSRSVLRIGDNVAANPINGDIDLLNTKFIINNTKIYSFGDKTLDTSIYDNMFNIITPQPVASITNDTITIDNVEYVRNSRADVTRFEQANSLKLVVNAHNFSLLDINDIYKVKNPDITTLGVKENIVF